MSTKYKISPMYHEAKIEAVEIIRETEKSVFIAGYRGKETRCSKESGYDLYFDTWDAAHDALTATADRDIDRARRTLEVAKSFQGNVKGMKKPAESAK